MFLLMLVIALGWDLLTVLHNQQIGHISKQQNNTVTTLFSISESMQHSCYLVLYVS
jgi:hypothetical protein